MTLKKKSLVICYLFFQVVSTSFAQRYNYPIKDYIGQNINVALSRLHSQVDQWKNTEISSFTETYLEYTTTTLMADMENRFYHKTNPITGKFEYDKYNRSEFRFITKNNIVVIYSENAGICTEEDINYYTTNCNKVESQLQNNTNASLYKCKSCYMLFECNDGQLFYYRNIDDYNRFINDMNKRKQFDDDKKLLQQRKEEKKLNAFLEERQHKVYDYDEYNKKDAEKLRTQINGDLLNYIKSQPVERLQCRYKILLYNDKKSDSIFVMNESVKGFSKTIKPLLDKYKLMNCFSKEFPDYTLNTKLAIDINIQYQKQSYRFKKMSHDRIKMKKNIPDTIQTFIADAMAGKNKGVYKSQITWGNNGNKEDEIKELKITDHRRTVVGKIWRISILISGIALTVFVLLLPQ